MVGKLNGGLVLSWKIPFFFFIAWSHCIDIPYHQVMVKVDLWPGVADSRRTGAGGERCSVLAQLWPGHWRLPSRQSGQGDISRVLIGRVPTLLRSHWSRASKCWNIFSVLRHHKDRWLPCTESIIRGAPNPYNRFFLCMEATYPFAIRNRPILSQACSLWHKRAGVATPWSNCTARIYYKPGYISGQVEWRGPLGLLPGPVEDRLWETRPLPSSLTSTTHHQHPVPAQSQFSPPSSPPWSDQTLQTSPKIAKKKKALQNKIQLYYKPLFRFLISKPGIFLQLSFKNKNYLSRNIFFFRLTRSSLLLPRVPSNIFGPDYFPLYTTQSFKMISDIKIYIYLC